MKWQRRPAYSVIAVVVEYPDVPRIGGAVSPLVGLALPPLSIKLFMGSLRSEKTRMNWDHEPSKFDKVRDKVWDEVY
jgi:hypothetical protein